MRRSTDINSKISFLFLNENICCDPSLEPSQKDNSNDGSQNMFLWKLNDNYPKIIPVTPFLSEARFNLTIIIKLVLCF